jgi:hypothetical protein
VVRSSLCSVTQAKRMPHTCIFTLLDGNSPLGAEVCPYVIESFEMEGNPAVERAADRRGLEAATRAIIDKRRLEIPSKML